MFLDDEEATARIRIRRTSVSLWVAVTALAACVVMMLALVGTARADQMPTMSQVFAPQLMVNDGPSTDQRILFGALIVVFSVAAAGLWRLSFRAPSAKHAARQTRGRISQF
jgi:hypothetical protein